MRTQHRQGLHFGQATDVQQILFTSAALPLPTHFAGKLGVVTPLGMSVQWQVIANQIDLVLQQCCNTALFPAGNGDRFVFPKHAVVHQQHIGTDFSGVFDGGKTRAHRRYHFADVFLALYLQAVGGIILKQDGLQIFITPSQNVATLCHGLPFFS